MLIDWAWQGNLLSSQCRAVQLARLPGTGGLAGSVSCNHSVPVSQDAFPASVHKLGSTIIRPQNLISIFRYSTSHLEPGSSSYRSDQLTPDLPVEIVVGLEPGTFCLPA